jgi:sensor histidine kinase YesM
MKPVHSLKKLLLLSGILLGFISPVQGSYHTEKLWCNWHSGNSALPDRVNCLHAGLYGYVFFGTSSGLKIFDGEGFSHSPLAGYQSASGWDITSFFQDAGNNLWFFSSLGESGFISMYTLAISTAANTDSLRNKYGKSWIQPGKRKKHTLPEGLKFSGISDSISYSHRYQNHLFIITCGTIKDKVYFVRDFYNGYSPDRLTPELWLEAPQLSGIVTDALGNLWVSSKVNGVYYMPNIYFDAVLYIEDGNWYANTLQTWYHNTLLLGLTNGILRRYNITRDKTDNIPIPPGFVSQSYAMSRQGKKLMVYNHHNKVLVLDSNIHMHALNLPGDKHILQILPRSDSSLLFSTSKEIYKFTQNTELLYRSNSPFQAFGLLQNGDLLIGSADGLYRKDLRSGKSSLFLTGTRKPVSGIYNIGSNILVFSSEGLDIIDEQEKVIRHFSVDDYLQYNGCINVKYCPPYVLIIQEVGLQVFDTNFTKPLLSLFTKSSLFSYTIKDAEVINGKLVLATEKYGIISLPFNDLCYKELPFGMHINAFKSGSKEGIDTASFFPFPASDTLDLLYQPDAQLFLNFDYFKSPSQLLFISYKLYPAGKPQDSTIAARTRGMMLPLPGGTILLGSLKPGDYLFEVIGKDSNNREQKDIKVIRIRPLWYQTIYFKAAFIGILLLLLIYIPFHILREKYRSNYKKKVLQMQVLQLQSASLKNQMNPHFIFNSLNPLQNYILKNDSRKGLKYLNSFASLLRNMLQHARKEHHSLYDEVTFLTQYLEVQQERYDHKFDFSIKVSDGINQDEISIPVLIVQSVVENAIEHGLSALDAGGRLSINIDRKDSMLTIVVTNNGAGFSPAELIREGHGLCIIKERLELMETTSGKKGSLSFKRVAQETICHIRIPIAAADA